MRQPALVVDPRGPTALPSPTVAAARRVLIVDDNVDAARTLKDLLQALGHTVEAVHDGVAALSAAESLAPEVVLLDIGLPGMDGYEVARALRRRPAAPKPVIVALSGYGSAEHASRAAEAGCDRHLVKPVDLTRLLQLIR